MTKNTSAIIDLRLRTRGRNVHAAEWTAQLVLGLRAFRRMVNAAGVSEPAASAPAGLGSSPQMRALPTAEGAKGGCAERNRIAQD
jgi:hypothetical protein